MRALIRRVTKASNVSGWLFAASHVASIAGPAGIASWVIGGFAVLLLGIVYCELGAALPRGLLVFYVVCGIGAAANVGIAGLLLRDGLLNWGLAGGAGALLTVVWNYAVSTTLVWRPR